MLNSWQYLLMLLAAVLAGCLNALAGGGTFITFPLLTAFGVPAITANVTNTVALCPGYIGAAWAQARGLRGQKARLLRLLPFATFGGIVGSYLLLRSSEHIFRAIVPFLILAAAGLLAAQEWLRAWISRRFLETKSVLPETPQRQLGEWWVVLPVALAAVYGGYFGAGLGVILLAVLGICLPESLPRLNALKPIISFAINGSSALFFVFSGRVIWPVALLMAVGALLGGAIGGRVANHLSAHWLRRVVVVLGVLVAVLYWLR